MLIAVALGYAGLFQFGENSVSKHSGIVYGPIHWPWVTDVSNISWQVILIKVNFYF